MIEIVDKFLDEYDLKCPENALLVGFSGGCDSLCLLDILNAFSKKYGFKLVALHLNHNWRGEESLQEELHCKKFCEDNWIEYVSETMSADGPKTESFARESRYNFFIKHAKKYPNSSIFTAHTRTDNAETLVYRLIKGTGIKGLQGILPKRLIEGFTLYRPLLDVSRNEIEDYCNSKGLVANNDSSNLNTDFKRNFIRHKIMPLFEEINSQCENSINSLAQLAISETNIVDEYIALIMREVCEDGKFLTEKFKNLSADVRQKIVYNLLLSLNLDYDRKKITDVLEFIKENFGSKSGSRYSLTDGLWLFVSSKHIYVITSVKSEENKEEIHITSEGEWNFSDDKTFSVKNFSEQGELKFPKETDLIALVNLDEVGLDLTLRTRRDGDFIVPFGMEGSMKLKKYLNSKAISQHEKDGLVLLAKGSEVLWVVGVGLSNKLKVVNKPTHVIELKNKL